MDKIDTISIMASILVGLTNREKIAAVREAKEIYEEVQKRAFKNSPIPDHLPF